MAGWTGVKTASAMTFAQTVTLDVSSVPANSVQEESFTVNGLRADHCIVVNKPTADAGLIVVGARVSATNTLALTFQNVTGTAINPASQNFIVVAF